jgi:hypothetical protein
MERPIRLGVRPEQVQDLVALDRFAVPRDQVPAQLAHRAALAQLDSRAVPEHGEASEEGGVQRGRGVSGRRLVRHVDRPGRLDVAAGDTAPSVEQRVGELPHLVPEALELGEQPAAERGAHAQPLGAHGELGAPRHAVHPPHARLGPTFDVARA